MEQITKELVAARLIPKVTKEGMPKLLEALKNIQVSRETVKVNFENLTKAMNLYTLLSEWREEELSPFKEQIKSINAGYALYMDQLLEILENVEPQFSALHRQIKMDQKAHESAAGQQVAIRKEYIEFVQRIIQLVLIAPDNKEVTRIQALIGSEKSREKHYGDFFETVKVSCDQLLELLTGRKGFLKEQAKKQKEYDKAVEINDLPRAAQLKEEMEFQERVLTQNGDAIAENAFQQIAAIDLTTDEFEMEGIKPRLSRWGWRVDDIELLFKKIPGLVTKEPNKKAIGAFMKEKTDEGNLNELEDNVFSGLVIFKKNWFVKPPNS